MPTEEEKLRQEIENRAKGPRDIGGSLARTALEIAAGVAVGTAVGAVFPPLGAALGASRIPGILRAGQALARTPTALRLFGRGAVEGGATGAIFADEGERGVDTARDAVLGGALSTALPYAGGAARQVGHLYNIARKKPRLRADKILENQLRGADRGILDNPEAMVADLSPQSTHYVQRGAPSSDRRLLEATGKRQEEALDRFSNTMYRAMHRPPSLTEIDKHRVVWNNAKDVLFERAYKEELPKKLKTGVIQSMRGRPAYRKAVLDASDVLQNEGFEAIAGEPNSVRELDKVLAALRAQKDKALAREDKALARSIDKIYRPLSRGLERKVKSYRKAMDYTREVRGIEDAFDTGTKAFDAADAEGLAISGRELRKNFNGLKPSEQNYFMAGALNSLFKGAQQTDQIASVVSNMSDRGTRAKLKAILDGPTFREIDNFARQETKFWRTFTAARNTSKKLPADFMKEALATGGDIARGAIWQSGFAYNTMIQNVTKKLLGRSDDKMYQAAISRLVGRTAPVSTGITPVGSGIRGVQVRGIGAAPALGLREDEQ